MERCEKYCFLEKMHNIGPFNSWPRLQIDQKAKYQLQNYQLGLFAHEKMV